MDLDEQVSANYSSGTLERTILDALRQAGKNPDRLTPDDLASIDELHLGGRPATADLAAQLDLSAGLKLLDAGSGIGGSARFLAQRYGCQVTGIDLTVEFVRVATELTRRCGLSNLVSFRQGSVLSLPFEEASFEGALTVHAGMNIAEKDRFFAEVSRVLTPGSLFAIYDAMRVAEGTLDFPMPWAETPDTSFVEAPDFYRHCLRQAGFTIVSERDRHDFALDFFRKMRERREALSLGLNLLMGETAHQKLGNAVAAVEHGVLSPIEIIARKG